MAEYAYIPHTIEQEYHAIERFTAAHRELTYFQLDSYLTQKVNLFALPEHERFYSMEFLLDKIIAALPALKRIFTKPITRLKDVTSILPVEAVRVINNATMGHIAIHTELWGNVDREGVRPKKLMTLSHEEDYKIYENIAFVRLVDGILSFVKKNVRLLKDILYACQPMRFNLLERTNHLMYFLAIGKLHVGYAHAQDTYHSVHQRCLEKLLFIDKTLRAKLKAPVYRICHKDKSPLTLKKTNVFRLQKDYRQVYALLKLFEGREEILNGQRAEALLPERGYADYCTLLSVFALGHFNFQFEEKAKLRLAALNAECTFKGWQVCVERLRLGEVEGVRYTAKKEKTYSICLLLYRGEKLSAASLKAFQEKYPADEFLYAEPTAYGAGGVYLSLFDLDSFRRIQQLVLRAMVYADEGREDCPFCGAPLRATASGFACGYCNTVISARTCAETGKGYFATELKDYKPPRRTAEGTARIDFFADKEAESALFFRNVTPLSAGKKLRCPHCGKTSCGKK